MVLSLRYRDLTNTINNLNNANNSLSTYISNLRTNVQNRMRNVSGGMNSTLSNADFLINRKIQQIESRRHNIQSLQTRVRTLHDTAQRVDQAVRNNIDTNRDNLFRVRPHLRPSAPRRMLISFLSRVSNIPILGSLIRVGSAIGRAGQTLFNATRHWFNTGGGRGLISRVARIVVGIVIAVVVAVVVIALIKFTGGVILAVLAKAAKAISKVKFVAKAIGAVKKLGATLKKSKAITSIAKTAKKAKALKPVKFAAKVGKSKVVKGIGKADLGLKVLHRSGIRVPNLVGDSNVKRISDIFRGIHPGLDLTLSATDLFLAVCGLFSAVESLGNTIDKLRNGSRILTFDTLTSTNDFRFNLPEALYNFRKGIGSVIDSTTDIVRDMGNFARPTQSTDNRELNNNQTSRNAALNSATIAPAIIRPVVVNIPTNNIRLPALNFIIPNQNFSITPTVQIAA